MYLGEGMGWKDDYDCGEYSLSLRQRWDGLKIGPSYCCSLSTPSNYRPPFSEPTNK